MEPDPENPEKPSPAARSPESTGRGRALPPAEDEDDDDDDDYRLPGVGPSSEVPKLWDASGDTDAEATMTHKWAPAHRPPPPRPQPEAPPSVRMSLPDIELPGERADFRGRYEVRSKLGQGGMGEVLLCQDRHLGREVAMKTILAEHASDERVKRRFEREVRVQGQLEHPAIVPVYDIGVTPEGAVYFTMKRLRGVTFHEILWKLRIGDEDALRTYTRRKLLAGFLSACQGVAFAHSRGVLHRDLKPANIMMGDFGEVYVLDWGLSKIKKSGAHPINAPDGQSTTLYGEVVGTPGYMAPEQAVGAARRIDERADVYSLGTILFEILTLQPLHRGDSASQAIQSTIHGTDCRPRARAPELDIPVELDRVVVRATSRYRHDRHDSAADLCVDIERFLDEERESGEKSLLARRHAAAARKALSEAQGGDADSVQAARVRATREVSAALALAPGDPEAMSTLIDVLLSAPPDLPAAAQKELVASRRSAARAARRGLLTAYLMWLVFVPPAVSLGVRSWTAGGLTLGLMLAATALAWANYRGWIRSSLTVFLAGSLALTCTSAVTGWALLLPGMVAVHTIAHLLNGEERERLPTIGLGLLTVAVPFALEIAGIAPPSYLFEGDRIVILPNLTHFPPQLTRAFLLVSALAVVLLPALLVTRVRSALSKTERRLFSQAWNLRSLLPRQARTAAIAAASPSTTGH